MTFVASVRDALREWFFLRDAEARAASYTAEQRRVVVEYVAAAERRMAVARDLLSPATGVAAAELLVEAIARLVRAAAAARDRNLDDAAVLELDVPSKLEELCRGGDRAPEAWQRAKEIVADRHPLALDRMRGDEAAKAAAELEVIATWLRQQVDCRSVTYIRGMRIGRLGAVALALVYLMYLIVSAAFSPSNVALGKPVRASSRFPDTPAGAELVDGTISGIYAIHTLEEDSPWIAIDLRDTFSLHAVRVYNRGDNFQDGCLPLILETSEDGEHYVEIARRTTRFGQTPPWEVNVQKRRARYVRLRGARRSFIALTEVEVLGRR